MRKVLSANGGPGALRREADRLVLIRVDVEHHLVLNVLADDIRGGTVLTVSYEAKAIGRGGLTLVPRQQLSPAPKRLGLMREADGNFVGQIEWYMRAFATRSGLTFPRHPLD